MDRTGGGMTDISKVASGGAAGASFNADEMAAFLVDDSTEGGEATTGDGAEELTPEEITEQLSTIQSKEATSLTDDEKSFLEKHAEKELSIEELKAKAPETLTDKEKGVLKDHEDGTALEAQIKAIQEKEESQRTDEEKQALQQYIDDNKPPSAIEQIKERFGNVEGDFTDDIDGIVSLIEKVGDTESVAKANEQLTRFPEVAQLLQHRAKGGSLESFMKTVRTPDYTNVELSETDVDGQRDMYVTYLKATGLPLADINELVQAAEDKGEKVLFDKAKFGQETMVKAYNAQVANEIAIEQKVEAENKIRLNNYWDEVNQTLRSGELEGIKISKEDLKTFESALKDVDDNQATQLDYKYAKLSVGQRLFLDYLVMKDFDVSGLNLQRNSKSKSLSSLLNQSTSTNQLSGVGTTKPAGEEFDISQLEFAPSKMKVI